MIDRLVCADGGNPDPTSTHGKDAAMAKRLELQGWPYPRHLKDRFFSVIVHGDVEGASGVRRALSDWLTFMELRPAGGMAEVDRYIGYGSPTPPATMRSTATPPFRRRSGTPRARSFRRSHRGAPGTARPLTQA